MNEQTGHSTDTHTQKTALRDALDLTDAEWEALSHRLQTPTAIAQTIGASDDNLSDYDRYHVEDIEAVASFLRDGDLDRALEVGPGITDEVLIDAVRSSRYLFEIRIRPEGMLKLSAIEPEMRAATSCARKVARYVGIDPDDLHFRT